MAETYERTTCACPTCVQCCHEQPGCLAAGDMEKIAGFLDLSVAGASPLFWASPGALLANRATGQTLRVGTITPRMQDGRCVFLDNQDRCSIHAVAPSGCAWFDTHTSVEESLPRSMALIQSQMTEGYQVLRGTLDLATSYKPRRY